MTDLKTKNKHRSDYIITWLSNHDLISRAALCEHVGYDRSNLQRVIDGVRVIPAKYLDAFESELEKYGYKKPL